MPLLRVRKETFSMIAKALICNAQQQFSLADVVLPDCGPDRMLVRALRTGVSIGTEFALVRNKISWGPYPLCLGYQGVGVVTEVGSNVTGFAPGDTVYYRDGKNLQLTDGTPVSAVTGTHCSQALINPKATHGVELLPKGVDPECGALFVMPSVSLYGVDMVDVRLGTVVLVYGCGQIGLGDVAFAARRGAITIAVDVADDRLAIARKLGADYVINGAKQDVATALRTLAPQGADTVFESTGIPACIDQAIPLAKANGKFVMQGNYGAAPISFHFLPAHGRRLTWFFPCDDGLAPCRRAVMKNMALGALDWQQVITHRVAAADSPALYDAINRGAANDVIGAVINWEGC
jgi:2-desacetyl-2-hydroxyethyl bacteriochlorophyllide A dehydrogenase